MANSEDPDEIPRDTKTTPTLRKRNLTVLEIGTCDHLKHTMDHTWSALFAFVPLITVYPLISTEE